MQRRFFTSRWAWLTSLALVLLASQGSSQCGRLNAEDAVVESASVQVAAQVDHSFGSQSVAVKTSLGSEQICVLPQDDIWVVATDQSCETGDATTEFRAKRLACNSWHEESLASLASSHREDPGRVTVVVVHGNNTDDDWALTRGMQFYDRVFGQHPCDRPSVRLVILSWESEKVRVRPLSDYRLKATRAVNLGPSVACVLNELGGPRPVLVGYSLGVQVVLSTLTHLPADLSAEHASSCDCHAGYHVALIAPALESNYACNCLGAIPTNPNVQRAEVFINRHDHVVCAARLINRKRCENRSIEPSFIAMADQGQLQASAFRLNDVTTEVRNRHSLINYVASATLGCRIRELTSAADVASIKTSVAVDQR